MMFIQVTDRVNKAQITINIEHIVAVQEDGPEICTIYMVSGDEFEIHHSRESIVVAIKKVLTNG